MMNAWALSAMWLGLAGRDAARDLVQGFDFERETLTMKIVLPPNAKAGRHPRFTR